MQQQHQWQFFRAGGVDQVVIRTGADIAHLATLDQKLWVALACPTRGIEFDTATLDMIDQDKDGRIRAPELLQACAWAVAHVQDPQILASCSDILQLDTLRTDTEEGQAMLTEAQYVLTLAGKADANTLSLADVQERLANLNAMPFNGDGVLNPAVLTQQPHLAAVVEQIMQTYGAQEGIDGLSGLGRAQVEQYFADLQTLAAWHAQACTQCGTLSETTQAMAAAKALMDVQAKVEDFFARVNLAAFDAKALDPLSPSVEGYTSLGQLMLGPHDAAIAALPLAPIKAAGSLPLVHGINPAWKDAMQALRQHAVQPLLGDLQSLNIQQWEQLKDLLQPCLAWLATRPASPLEDMTQQDVQALLTGTVQQDLLQLIQRDEDAQHHSIHVVALEKLIRLQRDLLVLLNNFVSFSSFYHRQGAMFQAGTLFLDGRSCDLTVDVADPAAHATLAGMAKVCLAYCECRRHTETRHIVAAFTAGDIDFLFVGRNGIFYDRQGLDWDASITKLIENPTSIGQAFFSPYRKFLRMVEAQVAKRAAAKDDSVTTTLDTQAAKLTDLSRNLQPAVPTATSAKKTDVGTVAAIGVALGSISAVMVGVFAKFIELGPWIPVALLGIVLAISGPSMLIAWLKLRERSLGPILDASGWAINGRMKINLPLGRSLSQMAKVPLTAKRSLHDPFAESRLGVHLMLIAMVLTVFLALAWRLHWLDTMLPSHWQHARPAAQTMQPVAPVTVPVENGG